MHLLQRFSPLAALLLLSVPSLRAQPAADPIGHWEGSIQTPNNEVRFEIDLARNTQGQLTGSLNQPAENLRGLQLANFKVEGNVVIFQIKGTPGERLFQGALSSDGQSISGDFTQGGYTIPFTVTRTGEARIEVPPKSAPIGKDLEGTWNATLAVNGTQRRLVLTMSNQPDGSATGSLVDLADGLEIPIATITQKGSSLTLEIKAVGSSYSGTLNADGTELSGTYTKGSRVLAVTFRRGSATEAKK